VYKRQGNEELIYLPYYCLAGGWHIVTPPHVHLSQG